MPACPPPLALEHLLLRLRPLQRALRVATQLRDASTARLREAGAVPEAISLGHVEAILDDLDHPAAHRAVSAGAAPLTDDELAAEQALRDAAASAATRLPLDALGDDLGLDAFERELLVLAAAASLDPGYERVFGFLHDDAARRHLTVELACALTATSFAERALRRTALGVFGRLRRLGLVAVTLAGSGLRDELHLAPAALDALLGAPVDPAVAFRDPAEVALPDAAPAESPALLAHAAAALAAGRVDTIALWGRARAAGPLIAQLAARAGLPLRRFPAGGADPATAVAAATALGALLWIDLDALGAPPTLELLELCCRARAPLVLTGAHAWRPPELLAARSYIELPAATAEDPDAADAAARWRAHLPDLTDAQLAPIAAGFRFDSLEIRAAARMARATAALRTNGHVVTSGDCLREACHAVARKHGERHTTFIAPRRGPDDLVLSPELHERVLDLARFFRALPRVMNDWGFARRISGGGGVKAMFTGDSGTGKTLAAEVVAREIGLPLLKVDLARVVSKWIGETEQNLDLAFAEARDSHAVLFFDEAEALFGARGDVRHATDRYANLEVSYLLQRLEDHGGVVILATNLRDKIDPAFTRRFHSIIGFPRPGVPERLRMWQRVFAPEIPRAGELDLAALARLDLTGAGIVGAAQTAALLAAGEDAPLSMRHVIGGLVRQFQREARVLTAHDLGPHAVHMERTSL